MNDVAVQTRVSVIHKAITSASAVYKIAAVAFTTSQVLSFGLAFFIWKSRS
jgi:hypothetical protein